MISAAQLWGAALDQVGVAEALLGVLKPVPPLEGSLSSSWCSELLGILQNLT